MSDFKPSKEMLYWERFFAGLETVDEAENAEKMIQDEKKLSAEIAVRRHRANRQDVTTKS